MGRVVVGEGMMVCALALVAAMAWGAEEGRVQSASGTVVAVTQASRTVVIESKLGGQPWIIGAEVTDQTKFGGKAKGLADLKAGDQVTIQWVRQEKGDVARSVTVR